VILNPAPAQPIGDDFLALADYLVVNESEAESLSGMAVIDAGSAERAALALRARGAATVLLTLGAQGVVMAGPHGTGFAPAVPVTAVDTTAAGDTFIGAFAVALLEGGSLSAAVARAQHAAALAVTRPGAQASVPHRAEVDDFMAAHGAA
jgi:ribokinase